MEFAQDWNQVLQSLLNKFGLPHYSFWEPEHLPILLLPAPSSSRSAQGQDQTQCIFFFLSPLDIQQRINQKSKVFRVARCSVSILSPGMVSATLKPHLFLPFSVWESPSLTRKTGAKQIQTLCFFYATGFKLQTYLYPNLFFSEYI